MKLVKNDLIKNTGYEPKINKEPYYEWIILLLFLIIVWLVYFIFAPFAAILTSPALILITNSDELGPKKNIEKVRVYQTPEGNPNVVKMIEAKEDPIERLCIERSNRTQKRFVTTLLNRSQNAA